MKIIDRLKAETPIFFKIVIKISIAASTIGGVIIGLPLTIPGLVLPELLIQICSYIITACVAVAAISKATVITPGE